MAMERGAGGGEWRVTRKTLLSTASCIGAVAVAATFGARFQHLLRTPA